MGKMGGQPFERAVRDNRTCRIQLFHICSLPTLLGALALLVVCFCSTFAPPAQALPSFARQTGQPCGTCHTDFPGLTPFGRRFKLLGYTVGGGMFRTTPFPTFPDNPRAQAITAQAAKMGMYLKAV